MAVGPLYGLCVARPKAEPEVMDPDEDFDSDVGE